MKNYDRTITAEHFRFVNNWIHNVEFTWYKMPKYVIKNIKNEKIIIGTGKKEEVQKYNPLHEVKDLFFKFAKIGEDPTVDKILEWVKKHGVLKYYSIPIIKHTTTGPEYSLPIYQPINKFAKSAKFCYEIFTLYNAVLNRNKEALKKRISIKKEEPGVLLYEIDGKPQPGIVSRDDSFTPQWTWYRDIALNYISSQVTTQLRKNKVTINKLDITNDRYGFDIDPVWTCPNLEAAMILQFLRLMIEQPNIIKCKKCNKPFKRNRNSRTLYCDKCRESGRQSDYYHRMKYIEELIQEGKNFEEIQKEVPRSKPETIKRKIEEYKNMSI